MSVPTVTSGRGAWSGVGKDRTDSLKKFYAAVAVPWDGSSPTKDVNYQAVSLGVKAIQTRVNEYADMFKFRKVSVDGNYSPLDREAVKSVQKILGFTGASIDGVVGPATAKAMFRDLVTWYSVANNVLPNHIWGMTSLESAFDPGAVGYKTPSDRGLTQINLNAHPGITVEQAFDARFALNYSADRLEKAREQFSGKGAALQRVCSIAQHNSPLQAKQWYETGSPPSEQIEQYVNLVLIQAATY